MKHYILKPKSIYLYITIVGFSIGWIGLTTGRFRSWWADGLTKTQTLIMSMVCLMLGISCAFLLTVSLIRYQKNGLIDNKWFIKLGMLILFWFVIFFYFAFGLNVVVLPSPVVTLILLVFLVFMYNTGKELDDVK